MRRHLAVLMLACATGVVGMPRPATAQVSVGVQLYWEWNDGAWRPHRYEWNGGRSAYYLDGRAVWVPREYVPPAGYCREWIPGVPVWRQPPAVPCDRLFHPYGYARTGVVIVGSVGFAGPVVRHEREGRVRRVVYEARPPRVVYKENARRVVHATPAPRVERGRVAVRRPAHPDQGHGRDSTPGRGRGNGDHGSHGNGNHGGRGRGGG